MGLSFENPIHRKAVSDCSKTIGRIGDQCRLLENWATADCSNKLKCFWICGTYFWAHVHDIKKAHVHDIKKAHVHEIKKAHVHNLKKAHENRRYKELNFDEYLMSKGENKFQCRISLF